MDESKLNIDSNLTDKGLRLRESEIEFALKKNLGTFIKRRFLTEEIERKVTEPFTEKVAFVQFLPLLFN